VMLTAQCEPPVFSSSGFVWEAMNRFVCE